MLKKKKRKKCIKLCHGFQISEEESNCSFYETNYWCNHGFKEAITPRPLHDMNGPFNEGFCVVIDHFDMCLERKGWKEKSSIGKFYTKCCIHFAIFNFYYFFSDLLILKATDMKVLCVGRIGEGVMVWIIEFPSALLLTWFPISRSSVYSKPYKHICF